MHGGPDTQSKSVRRGSAGRRGWTRWRWRRRSGRRSTFHGRRTQSGRVPSQRFTTVGRGSCGRPTFDVQCRKPTGQQTGQCQSPDNRGRLEACAKSAQHREHRGESPRWRRCRRSPLDAACSKAGYRRYSTFDATRCRGCECRQHRWQSSGWIGSTIHPAGPTRFGWLIR
jgi:hypothetical protein